MLVRHSHADKDREEVFDVFHEALLKVDENLIFEFGPPAAKARVRRERGRHQRQLSSRPASAKSATFP
jgi:hypothetical protein